MKKMMQTLLVLAFGMMMFSAVAQDITGSVTPIKMVPKSAGDIWVSAATKVMADAIAGTLKDTTGESGYMLCKGQVMLSDLVYATYTTRQVVCQVVDLRSKAGLLSMGKIAVTSKSSDSFGALNDTYVFDGIDHTAFAVLIKADGTMVTSGSSDQAGVRVVVLVFMKTFLAETPKQDVEAQNWMAGYADYSVYYSAQIRGDNSTKVSVGVSLNGITPPVSGSGKLEFLNSGLRLADRSGSYTIWTSSSLKGQRTVLMDISGEQVVPVLTTNHTQFYWAVAK